MQQPNSPGPRRSTSEAAFNEAKKEVARRNEEAHKEARRRRTAREQEQIARRRKWEQQT